MWLAYKKLHDEAQKPSFTVVVHLTHWLDAERKIPIALSCSPKDVPNMYLNAE